MSNLTELFTFHSSLSSSFRWPVALKWSWIGMRRKEFRIMASCSNMHLMRGFFPWRWPLLLISRNARNRLNLRCSPMKCIHQMTLGVKRITTDASRAKNGDGEKEAEWDRAAKPNGRFNNNKKAEIMNECASNETKRKTYPWHKAIYLSSLFDQILVSGWVRCVFVCARSLAYTQIHMIMRTHTHTQTSARARHSAHPYIVDDSANSIPFFLLHISLCSLFTF